MNVKFGQSQDPNSEGNQIPSSDSSEVQLRKRIFYNDSAFKSGGGGTGLMYGNSDKSSSSSKKLEKKGSRSSSSSGIKDLHAGPHSHNSSSEKSDQRHFDRLMRRNEILDFYEFQNDHTDYGDSSNKNRLNSSNVKKQDQMSEIEEAEFEVEDNGTPENNSKSAFYRLKNKPAVMYSEEKIITHSEGNLIDSKDAERLISSDSKLIKIHKSDNDHYKPISKTPDKVPYDYVSGSDESKEPKSESGSKTWSSHVTPLKHLETITEQATDLEMDNTHCIKSESSWENSKPEIHFKTPCEVHTKFISPTKIRKTEDHKSLKSAHKSSLSFSKLSSIKSDQNSGVTPVKKSNERLTMMNVFTPSPDEQKHNKAKVTPIKVYKINQVESGTTKRFIGHEIKSNQCPKDWTHEHHHHLTRNQYVRSKSQNQSKGYKQSQDMNGAPTLELTQRMNERDQMYSTHRENIANGKFQDLKQITLQSASSSVLRKEMTSTQPESKDMYSTIESKITENQRQSAVSI